MKLRVDRLIFVLVVFVLVVTGIVLGVNFLISLFKSDPGPGDLKTPVALALTDRKSGDELGTDGQFAVIGDTIYYRAEDDTIRCAPLSDPKQSELVYSLQNLSDNPDYQALKLGVMDGIPTISYYSGDVATGERVVMKILPNGNAERIAELSNGNVAYTDDAVISLNQHMPPFSANLFKASQSSAEIQPFADSLYYYGFVRMPGSEGIDTSADLAIYGDQIYVLAVKGQMESGALNWNNSYSQMAKVDLNSGITEIVSDIPISHFAISGDTLWMQSYHEIYRMKLPDGEMELMLTTATNASSAENIVSRNLLHIAPLADELYYFTDFTDEDIMEGEQVRTAGELYRLGVPVSPQPGIVMEDLRRHGDYVAAHFRATSEQDATVLFDERGQAVFSSSKHLAPGWISISGRNLVYTEEPGGTLYWVVLPEPEI